jgi:hypothetical protein
MPGIQLPLPLVYNLPYVGDDTGCHIWDFDAAEPDDFADFVEVV